MRAYNDVRRLRETMEAKGYSPNGGPIAQWSNPMRRSKKNPVNPLAQTIYTDGSLPLAVPSPDPNGFGYDGNVQTLRAVWADQPLKNPGPSYQDAYGKDVRTVIADDGHRKTYYVNNPGNAAHDRLVLKERMLAEQIRDLRDEMIGRSSTEKRKIENRIDRLERQLEKVEDKRMSTEWRNPQWTGNYGYIREDYPFDVPDESNYGYNSLNGQFKNPEGTMTMDGTLLSTKDSGDYGYVRDRVPAQNNPHINWSDPTSILTNPVSGGLIALVALVLANKFFRK